MEWNVKLNSVVVSGNNSPAKHARLRRVRALFKSTYVRTNIEPYGTATHAMGICCVSHPEMRWCSLIVWEHQSRKHAHTHRQHRVSPARFQLHLKPPIIYAYMVFLLLQYFSTSKTNNAQQEVTEQRRPIQVTGTCISSYSASCWNLVSFLIR